MHYVSRKSFIAIEAVLYIACHSGAEPIRSKDICVYQGVSMRYLEHILQALVHAGILRGVRGPKGGYLLAKERRKICIDAIMDAITALENKEADTESSSELLEAVIMPLQCQLQDTIKQMVGELTIQDLCERAEEKQIAQAFRKKADFTI